MSVYRAASVYPLSIFSEPFFDGSFFFAAEKFVPKYIKRRAAKMKKMRKQIAAILLAAVLTIFTVFPVFTAAAAAKGSGGITIETTLTDGAVQKGSKKTFDVWAKDAGGDKISSSVTLNGASVSVNWDDEEKTSYTLTFKKEGENTVVVSASADGETETQTYTITYEKAQKGDIIGYATWSIEAFTVGNGYIVEPIKVPVKEGVNAARTLDQVVKGAGLSYSKTGSLDSSFYLSSIKSSTEKLNIKENIPSVLKDQIGEIGDFDKSSLGEFDFTSMSGWMYCINNVFPNVGFADSYLADGDVVRTQFTLAYGSDIGGGWGGSYYSTANKDRLTQLLGEFNSSPKKAKLLKNKDISEAYSSALETIQQLEVGQSSIDSAYYSLSDAMGLKPLDGISLNKTELSLKTGGSDTLKIIYDPKDTDENKTASWSSSDSSVAKVLNGKVTAVGEGTAEITAKVGDYTAFCEVTVQASHSSSGNSSDGSAGTDSSMGDAPTVQQTDTGTKISIAAEKGVLPQNAQLSASPVAEDTENYRFAQNILKDIAQRQTIYEISLSSDGIPIQPNGKVTVRLPIPEGYNRGSLAIVRVMPDGTFQSLDFVIDGDFLVVQTGHFSLYAIVEKSAEASSAVSEIPAQDTGTANTKAAAAARKEASSPISSPKTGEQPVAPVIAVMSVSALALLVLQEHRKCGTR